MMEYWSFPPKFDPTYRPPSDSPYWFPQRETMPAADREAAILQRLQEVCAYAYANAPFYRWRWDEAGFHPTQLKSLEDFEERVPVTIELVHAGATMGDIIEKLRGLWGTYRETPVF